MMPTELHSMPWLQDPFSSLSHLVAAIGFAIAGVVMVRKGVRARAGRSGPESREPDAKAQTGLVLGSRMTSGGVAAVVVFVAASVILLVMSGLFHMMPPGPVRLTLQRLDHAAIFVLIAGTFTPTHAMLFRGPWRWGMLVFIWTFAVLGVVQKAVLFGALPEWAGIGIYLVMGWCGIFSMVALARRRVFELVKPLLFGGLAYTAGAIIEGIAPPPLIRGVVRAHELFHVAVVIGLFFHWQFVWRLIGAAEAPDSGGALGGSAGAESEADRVAA